VNDAASLKPVAEQLADAGEALRRSFPSLESAVKELLVALKFGHTEGFPGWPEIQEIWARVPVPGGEQSAQGLPVRMMRSAVKAYFRALAGEEPASVAAAYADACVQVFVVYQESDPAAPDTNAVDEKLELARHREAMEKDPRGGAVRGWYVEWLSRSLKAMDAFEQRRETNVLEDLVKIVFDNFDFPKRASTQNEAAELHGYGLAVQQLAAKHLSRLGCEIIEPVPGQDSFEGSRCESTNDQRSGPIERVEERGVIYRDKGFTKKAKVKTSREEPVSATPTPDRPQSEGIKYAE
jgi:hypothetical protein